MVKVARSDENSAGMPAGPGPWGRRREGAKGATNRAIGTPLLEQPPRWAPGSPARGCQRRDEPRDRPPSLEQPALRAEPTAGGLPQRFVTDSRAG
ncbi:hypothetical protein GCM10023168_24430 [Fodinibacter luteus]|uniref:Uncharacterized protein n=1 Tax=Fodinibacter luteus TaxID=552064 RepID=A0ABP8KJC3_9MICO